MLNSLFKSIRAKGYAMQERVINPKAASISVPIMVGRNVHGCMSLIFIASALTMSDVEKQAAAAVAGHDDKSSPAHCSLSRVSPARPAAATAR